MAYFTGTAGADLFNGGAESDTANGGAGDDTLNGGGGDDALRGEEGADILDGGAGSDYIYASTGEASDAYADVLRGGEGDDFMYGGYRDVFDGGAGTDYAYVNLKAATTSIIFDLANAAAGQAQALVGGGSIVGVEILDFFGGSAADRVFGASQNDLLRGGQGHDALYGRDGRDNLYGDEGRDVLRGGAGDDIVLEGGAGGDRVMGGDGADYLWGDGKNPGDTDGDDQLDGGKGDDNLHGGGGADIIVGGAGDDLMFGAAGADRFGFFAGAQGADAIRDFNAAEDRFDLDGRLFTGVAAGTANGSLVTYDGGTIQIDGVTGLSLAQWNALVTTGANTHMRLTNAFDNILRYSPTSDADLAFVKGLTDSVVAGTRTEAAAVAQIVAKADASTAVATLNYQFFTGKTPGEAGMDYLLSPIGPNANNLNSDYYRSFDSTNRSINFAVNLGRDGEGKAKFDAEYGGLSLFDATRKAYAAIFGPTPDDKKIHDLIDSRVEYLTAYGKTEQGTKAAMVGWLLAEAEKADTGVMAKANAAYLTDLADEGPFAVNLVTQYGEPAFGVL